MKKITILLVSDHAKRRNGFHRGLLILCLLVGFAWIIDSEALQWVIVILWMIIMMGLIIRTVSEDETNIMTIDEAIARLSWMKQQQEKRDAEDH